MFSRVNMQSIFAFLCFAVVVVGAAPSSNEGTGKDQTIRFVRAYTQEGEAGPYEDFFDYSPDLSLDGLDNAINSANKTGLWIFYNDINYDGLSCPAFGISAASDLDDDCAGEVSSIRYAGNPDGLNADYFNLYEGEGFTGAEFRSNVSAITVGDIDLAVSSIIVSGTAEWTFFTGAQFHGSGICVSPDSSYTHDDGTVIDYATVSAITSLGLADNAIRSVVKGCVDKRAPHGSLGDAAGAIEGN